MLSRLVRGAATFVVMVAASQTAYASGLFKKKGCCDDPCAPACPPACNVTYKMEERTVMVPQMVTEMRKVKVTECRPEIRDRVVTYYESVPETKDVQREVCHWVPETKTRTEKYWVCKPVWKQETREYTVMVPHTETRTGTRRVCHMVPVKETRTICVDEGCWEERCVVVCCKVKSDCGGCVTVPVTKTCRVWVPKMVQKQVEVTCMKPEYRDEPCQYTVTVCKPEKRTCTVNVCHYEREERTREVCYTECKLVRKTETCKVTTYKCVAKQRTEKCTVMVPHVVEKEVPVTVCKMVEKKVMCKVACPAPAPACEPCCDPCAKPCKKVKVKGCCGGSTTC